jgi:hypothetical protein
MLVVWFERCNIVIVVLLLVSCRQFSELLRWEQCSIIKKMSWVRIQICDGNMKH